VPRPAKRSSSPAQRFARGGGLLLIAVGLVSIPGSLDSDHGWNIAVLLVCGGLGVAAAGRWDRDYALGFGLLFVALGIWGLAAGSGSQLVSGFTASTFGSLFDLVFGLAGLGAGAATPSPGGRSAEPRRPAREARLAGAGGASRKEGEPRPRRRRPRSQ